MKKLALLFVSALALSGCGTVVSHKEAQLDAAGFRATPADTAERQALLTGLPAQKLMRVVDASGTSYTYADPLVCNCLYIGSDAAFSNYRRLMAASRNAMPGAKGNDTPNLNINTSLAPHPALQR